MDSVISFMSQLYLPFDQTFQDHQVAKARYPAAHCPFISKFPSPKESDKKMENGLHGF